MTINESIEHALEQSKINPKSKCAKEHAQLASWLKELKAWRSRFKNSPCGYDGNSIVMCG